MNDIIKNSIGETLRNIRKSNLLNVAEVSKNTGINKDTIYRYERGKGNDLEVLSKLLEYYQIPDFIIFFNKVYDNCHKK